MHQVNVICAFCTRPNVAWLRLGCVSIAGYLFLFEGPLGHTFAKEQCATAVIFSGKFEAINEQQTWKDPIAQCYSRLVKFAVIPLSRHVQQPKT